MQREITGGENKCVCVCVREVWVEKARKKEMSENKLFGSGCGKKVKKETKNLEVYLVLISGKKNLTLS